MKGSSLLSWLIANRGLSKAIKTIHKEICFIDFNTYRAVNVSSVPRWLKPGYDDFLREGFEDNPQSHAELNLIDPHADNITEQPRALRKFDYTHQIRQFSSP